MNTRNKSLVRLLVLIIILPMLNACDVFQQAQKMAYLSKCDFRMQSVNQLVLAGINVQNIHKLSDLSLLDAAKLTNALATNQFPLDFTLNIEARNPNTADAGLTKMDWILFIDNIEMTRGALNQQVTIPANNATAIIPMKMHIDLKQALSGKSADAILNFGLNLAGAGNKPTRFTLKLQPTINVASIPITYPGYITIGTEYGGTAK
jgi:hypothetical protein